MKRKALSTVAVLVACVVALLRTPNARALNLKLSGINYDFRRGPDWDDQRCKTSAVITKEMKLLQTITNRVRIYSLTDCNVRDVLRSATTLNMTVWLGLWVSNNTSVFTKELAMLKTLISEKLVTNELVDGINVGSESLYRKEVTPQVLIENYKTVKTALTASNLKIPLSITDTLDVLVLHPEVVTVQDVVTFNVFPFWNRIAIDKAVDDLETSINNATNLTNAKPFIIAETGWPAGGFNVRGSEASPTSAARYMNEFVALATKKGWKYYYFAGFDTPYRKELDNQKDSVEAYFGIFNVSGKLNTHYEALTINVTNMPDGLAIPLDNTVPTPASGVAPRSRQGWRLIVAALTFTVTLR